MPALRPEIVTEGVLVMLVTRRVVAELQFSEVSLYCTTYSFVVPEAGGLQEALTEVGDTCEIERFRGEAIEGELIFPQI